MHTTGTKEDLSQRKPPHLIFGESHDDPAVKKIMLRMLKKLEELGYESIYDEAAENDSANEMIEQLKAFQTWHSDLMEKTIDVINDGRIPTYKELKEIYNENQQIMFILKLIPGQLAALSLMLELRSSKINYVPIDINPTGDITYGQSPEGMNKRDKHMADKYLKADHPVFGLVGSSHLQGMKEYLPDDNFQFFYIYSSTHSRLTGHELDIYEMRLKKDIPKGVYIFDIDKTGEEQIVNTILDIIKSHVMMMPKDIKEKPIKKSLNSAASPLLFDNPTSSDTAQTGAQWKDCADVCNYLYSHKYDPAIVSATLTIVLDNHNIEKLYPESMDLYNLLSYIFIKERPAINKTAHEKLKTECFDLLLNNKDYFSKFNDKDYGILRIGEIFPDKFEQINKMCVGRSLGY